MKCDLYLTFDGNCEEALDFYKEVFNGTYQVVMRYADGPPEYNVKGNEDKIMHATMTFGDGCELKASDSFHMPIQKGNAYHVSILADNPEQGAAFFDKLSQKGQITMPYQEVFWGGNFGSLIDAFGIQWMISSPH
jgi:PhnB protein